MDVNNKIIRTMLSDSCFFGNAANVYRLVGEGLYPEKINIKAFLVSFDAEWYHE